MKNDNEAPLAGANEAPLAGAEWACSHCNTLTDTPAPGEGHKWEKVYPIPQDVLSAAERAALQQRSKAAQDRNKVNERVARDYRLKK